MHPYSTVSPITQRLVQVHATVEKIPGVNGPLPGASNRQQGLEESESPYQD